MKFFLFFILLFFIDIYGAVNVSQKAIDTLVVANDTVSYKSDRITYDILNKKIYFKDNNQIFYKNMKLSSDSISMDMDSSVLFSTKNIFLVDVKSRDTIWLDSLKYDLKHNKGLLWNLSTKFENKYITGSVVKKDGKDTYFGKYVFFTTELDSNPQTYFYTKMGRMDNKTRVAYGKPVIMNVADVPVVALPVFIYPMAGKKRKSGFLRPSYGGGETSGRYIKNIGYYFVLNDYSDIKIKADYYEGKKIAYGGVFRFNHWFWTPTPSTFEFNQYRSIDYFNDVNQIDNEFRVAHKNYLDRDKNISLSLNGVYMSSENVQDNYSLQTLDQQLQKNTDLSGGILGKIGNISVSTLFKRSANLSRQTINWIKPSMGLHGFPILRYSTLVPLIYGKKKWFYKSKTYDPTKSFLDKFYISCGGIDFQNIENYDDSLHENKKKWGYSIPFQASINGLKLGQINIVPSFNFSHVGFSNYRDSLWKDHYSKVIIATDSLGNSGLKRVYVYKDTVLNEFNQQVSRDSFYVDTSLNRFTMVNSYSSSISANTQLYGVFKPNIFGIKGLRHVLSPNISYTYSPGKTDPYHYGDCVSGRIYSSKSKSIGIGLGQSFDMKWQYSDTSKVKYFNLLRLSSGISYNYESDYHKLSSLSNSVTVPMLPFFSSGFSVDFYDGSDEYSMSKTNVESYHYSFNFPITIRGKIFDGDLNDWGKIDLSPTKFSFSSGLNVSYSGRRVSNGIYSLNRSISTNLSTSFDLSRTTHLTYTANVDLSANKIVNHTFSLEKKIRRWRMSLYWIPKGPAKRLDFKVYFVDFGDLKIEKMNIRY